MKAELAAPFRSARARAAASYPFRLGSADSKWSDTPFSGLAIVNSISASGDALVTVALAGSVFVSVSLHAARGRTALGLICTVLPFIVVGPLIGPAIDRARGGRKFIVFLASIGRMGACLMMAAWIHSLLLFPAAFLSLVCSKTHAVAKASLVPGVVDKEEELVRANSKLAMGSAVVTAIAAVIGGAIYKLFGSHALLDLDVLVFAAGAALSLYLLRGSREPASRSLTAERGEADPDPGPPRPRRRPSGRPGLLHVFRAGPRPPISRELVLAQVAMAGMRATAGFMTALVVFGFRREGAPVIWYGLVAVASVGGNFTGALIAPRLRERIPEKLLLGGAAVLIGLTAIGVTQVVSMGRRPAALILAGVVAVAASVAKTAFDAMVQRDTKDEDRSRLFARFESIFQLAWVAGALIPTLIATSLFSGFIVAATVVILSSGLFVVGLARPENVGSRARSAAPSPSPPPPPSPSARSGAGAASSASSAPASGHAAAGLPPARSQAATGLDAAAGTTPRWGPLPAPFVPPAPPPPLPPLPPLPSGDG